MNIGVLDCSFPSKKPFGFRNKEITGLLSLNQKTVTFTPQTTFPGTEAWFNHPYGASKTEFSARKDGFLKYYPEYANRLFFIKDKIDKDIIILSYFLADTYTYLPLLEKNNTPFVFILYPGGGFGINNKSSDAMLSRIFLSKQFRRVIVTSDITERYLMDTMLCDPNKVSYLWGGVSQFDSGDFISKLKYPLQKDTIDVIFVAFKYSEGGYDKGFDILVECAKKLHKYHKPIVFHVVGDLMSRDINTNKSFSNIVFHGILLGDELKELYKKMDIQLSFSRNNILYNGNFDGFPLGIDAFQTNTLLITSDDMNQNGDRFSNDEYCKVKLDVNDISSKIIFFANHPNIMYKVSARGTAKADNILNSKKRVVKLNSIMNDEIKKIKKDKRRG